MARHPLRLLSLCAAFLASHAAFAAVTLQVTSSVHTESVKGVTNPPADTRQVMEVTLSDDYTAVKMPKVELIYDFKARRYYVLDTVNKVYVDYSLYSIAGFRTMELKNRENINAMLAKAKIDTPLSRQVDREQELAVADDDAVKIDESAGDGTLEFSSDGRKLASWSKAGAKVTAADAARFAQFLRYTQAGHPQLLARLARDGVIPGQLTFTVNTGVGVRTVSIGVAEVKSARPPAYDLKGYAPRVGQAGELAGELDIMLDRMAALTPERLAPLRAAHPCDTAADYRDDQPLDTMLGRTECVLATGEPMLPFTPAQLQKMREDPAVGLMLASVSPKNKEEYEGAVKTLAELRKQAPRKAYVLKLLEANNRLRLGQRKESLQLFGEVLEANPVLGGAYKDLGDLLLLTGDSPRAWRSWDIGRAIAPKVPNFTAVNDFEAQLLKRHPEFF
jgi:tetratricopeptide (TPR) repeat protein